jgi:hypothetical protein
MTMTRLKTRDYHGDLRKKLEKGFLVYQEERVGKDWIGRTLRCHDNFEGVYREISSEPEAKWNYRNGRSEVVGKRLTGTHGRSYGFQDEYETSNREGDWGHILLRKRQICSADP